VLLASGKEGKTKAKLEAEWWEGKRWESAKGEGEARDEGFSRRRGDHGGRGRAGKVMNAKCKVKNERGLRGKVLRERDEA
jgi:hypothetical protein